MTLATRKYCSNDFVLFLCEVENAHNGITFKISSDDKLSEIYTTTTSLVSATDTAKLPVTTAIHHLQQFIAIKLHRHTARYLKYQA